MTEEEKKAAKKAAAIAAAKAAREKREAAGGGATTAVLDAPSKDKPLSEMTEEEKKAAKKAAAIAAAKAAREKREAASGSATSVQDAPSQVKPLNEMTEEEKKAAKKAAAIAAARARAAQPVSASPGTSQTKAKPSSDKQEAAVTEKRISKKMALSVILFAAVILASSSAFAMKLLNWNDYNDGTQLEKQYRANIEKLKENPQDLQVRYELLVAMYKKGLHDEAKTQLSYILAHASADSKVMLDSSYYKALYDSLSGKNEEAIATYQQFLKANPGNGEAWLNLSYLQYSIGHYEEAAITLGTAGVLLPTSPEVPYLRGMLFMKNGKEKEAEVMFKKAIELDRDHQKSIDMLKTLKEKGEK